MSASQVLTAYIDVSLPVKDRQAALTETYHFQCTCQLCRREQLPGTVSSRQAVLHPGCAEAGWANLPGKTSCVLARLLNADFELADLAALGEAQLVCNKCQQSFSVAVQRLANLIEAGQEILAADASGRLREQQGIRSFTSALILLRFRIRASSAPTRPCQEPTRPRASLHSSVVCLAASSSPTRFIGDARRPHRRQPKSSDSSCRARVERHARSLPIWTSVDRHCFGRARQASQSRYKRASGVALRGQARIGATQQPPRQTTARSADDAAVAAGASRWVWRRRRISRSGNGRPVGWPHSGAHDERRKSANIDQVTETDYDIMPYTYRAYVTCKTLLNTVVAARVVPCCLQCRT